MFFNITQTGSLSSARLGIIEIPHGKVHTPVFLPRYSSAASKLYSAQELKFWGAEMLSVEAYDFWLKPGDFLIHSSGGIHKFLGWGGPIMTLFDINQTQAKETAADQVSPPVKLELSEGSVTLHLKNGGPSFKLTPEQAVQIQSNFGSDIAVALQYPGSGKSRSVRERIFADGWRTRPLRHFEKIRGTAPNPSQKIFASEVKEGDQNFDGVVLDAPAKKVGKSFAARVAGLPSDKPRYLVSAGLPDGMLAAVASGIDLLGSSAPETYGCSGKLFIDSKARGGYEVLDLRAKKSARDAGPPDSSCTCYVCLNFSRADLFRLFFEDLATARRFACIHNLNFYFQLLEKVRRAITYGSFGEMLKNYKFRR
jgi:queuine tRNA-ribosyltransferase